MNLTITLQEYLDELASSSPTPGGGNVAALCGVLASSLGIMVCNLTIGKKKYSDVEEEINKLKESLDEYKNKFTDLAKLDNEAFDKVMDAFKLPKETEEEKNIRLQKIENATMEAAEVPSNVMKYCGEILPILKSIAEKGNKNSLSDAGVAVALVRTALQGAYFNVLINCSSLQNQTIAAEIRKPVDSLFQEVDREVNYLILSITKSLNPL